MNYAGAFPPDLDHESAIAKMQNIPVHMLVGDADEYISLEKFAEHISHLEKLGFTVKQEIFEGEHKLYKPTLESLFNRLLNP